MTATRFESCPTCEFYPARCVTSSPDVIALETSTGVRAAPPEIGAVVLEDPPIRIVGFVGRITRATARSLEEELSRADADPAVAGVLLFLESSGGDGAASDEAVAALRGLGKPSVCYVPGYALSAGLALATAAGRVVVEREASLGSVGVCYAECWAGKPVIAASGPLKDPEPYIRHVTDTAWNPLFEGLAEEGVLEGLARFADQLAEHRGVDRARLLSRHGAGGTMTAQEAQNLGLVDVIDNFHRARRLLLHLIDG